jgi:hypothetical protein
MGFVNKNNIFLNRDLDLKHLGQDVLTATKQTICIVSAPKGTGKTALIDRVIETYSQKHKSIIVNPGSACQYVQGKYIQAIFDAFYSQENPENIDKYFKSLHGNDLKLYINFLNRENILTADIISKLCQILLWILPLFLSLLGINFFPIDSIFYQYKYTFFACGIIVLFFSLLFSFLSRNSYIQLHFTTSVLYH